MRLAVDSFRKKTGIGAMPRQHVVTVGVMVAVADHPSRHAHGPDERNVFHHPRCQREMLADLNARHRRRDGRKDAAILQRSVRLHVPRIQLARSTEQKDDDAPLGSTRQRPARRHARQPEQLRDTQPQRTDPQTANKFATIKRRHRMLKVSHGHSRLGNELGCSSWTPQFSMLDGNPALRHLILFCFSRPTQAISLVAFRDVTPYPADCEI